MSYEKWADEFYAKQIAEARREQVERDVEIAQEHECETWHECCDCRAKIAAEIRKANEVSDEC